jgi:hypothetical protein
MNGQFVCPKKTLQTYLHSVCRIRNRKGQEGKKISPHTTALLVGRSWDQSPVTGDFFSRHQTVPFALGSTQPLKMSTRIILGVKTAGA